MKQPNDLHHLLGGFGQPLGLERGRCLTRAIDPQVIGSAIDRPKALLQQALDEARA
jgi:hypothetical protein